MSDSVGALHIALVAAVVGWLVFSISHAIAVWNKRHAERRGRRSLGLIYVAVMLCLAGCAGGWLNRELTRRAGVISGTDFFVVRAHAKATPHLIARGPVAKGATLATFDEPELDREEEHLRGEILTTEGEVATAILKPLELNPDVLRQSQNAHDLQRARLTELGFGVPPGSAAGPVGEKTHGNQDPLAAQRAKSEEATKALERTSALVSDGILAREKLETAKSAAQAARQVVREREQLIQATQVGYVSVANADAGVARDAGRAKAERSAEVAALQARVAGLRADLSELDKERDIPAPFNGTVVYRHATPALASEGQVILALSRDTGFLAEVQVPAREAKMLLPGAPLRLKLQHSLVTDEISGRLRSIEFASDSPDRANLLIECDLPPEQFGTFASGSVPVLLEWRPALLSEPFTRGGIALAGCAGLLWLFLQLRPGLSAASDAEDGALPTDESVAPDAADVDPMPEDLDRVLAQLEPDAVACEGSVR